jgi:hypothetical protein
MTTKTKTTTPIKSKASGRSIEDLVNMKVSADTIGVQHTQNRLYIIATLERTFNESGVV